MKFVDEYRDPAAAEQCVAAIRKLVTRPWTIMEVCGGQTHAILKYGIDELLPAGVTLLHGPGCPVCVTPLEKIDRAVALASRPDVIFCSFGDMLRVPGTDRDLLSVKAAGGDVRIVYSPLDALAIARDNPGRQVVFFAVGFETTAPGNAMAVFQAKRDGIANFSILVSHVLVPPALEAILSSPSCRVQGFLAAGHVCSVMGYREYLPIAERYHVPIVVTGFEPLDLLQGIYLCLKQLEEGRAEVENQYARVVTEAGNQPAQALVSRGVPGRAPGVARHRRDSRQRPGPAGRVRGVRRRAALRPERGGPEARAGRVHRGPRPAGAEEAAPSARRSAGAARPSTRSARRWCRRRGRARRTTGTRRYTHHDPAATTSR